MKQKTKKAAAKRFKITKTGKIIRRRQMASHLKAAKSKTARSRYKTPAHVARADRQNIARLLPHQ